MASRARRVLWIVLLMSAAGCGTLQKTPWIGRLFIPRPKYYSYVKHPRFYCEYPRVWGEPAEIHDGIELRSPDKLASISIVYIPAAEPGYKPPETYRQVMTSWGSVEDAHRLFQVSLSTTPAYKVQYTTYEYDSEHLLGEQVRVLSTEVLMAPYYDGMYVVRFMAEREAFEKRAYRKHYEHFLQTLQLATPPPQE